MAGEAKVHAEIECLDGDRLLRHVAVALLAGNSSVDMRCMPEPNVRSGIKPEDSLPGDLLAFGSEAGQFLDFRFIRCNHLMACHTKGDARNSRVGSLGHASVTAAALQIMLEVNFVIEGDRLDRRGLQKKEFSDCPKHSLMGRSKDSGDFH